MPWCPVCKSEYVEGKTHCPDCDVDLVDELLPEQEKQEEIPTLTEEEQADILARRAAASQARTYTSAREKQSENRSSAWTFLLVGGIGLVVITLALLGVVKLPLNTFSLAVMEVIFVIFLIIAALSFRKVMRLMDEIAKEDTLDEKIWTWMRENLTKENLTADVDVDTTEELQYFIVSEQIRKQIMLQFPEIDDAYAEDVTENFYNELFLYK
ncbi:MAG: hypothetical protein LUC60_03725 [Lachnospiraceae bacterium]|nr:hypothetical protein [Lachnospiraceae bacterium]